VKSGNSRNFGSAGQDGPAGLTNSGAATSKSVTRGTRIRPGPRQAESSGRRKEERGGKPADPDPQTSSGYLEDFGVDPFLEDAVCLPSRRYASKAASATGRNRSWRSSGKGRSNREERRPKAPGGREPRSEERAGELLACLMNSFRVATAVPGGSAPPVAKGLRGENASPVRFASGSTRLQNDIFAMRLTGSRRVR